MYFRVRGVSCSGLACWVAGGVGREGSERPAVLRACTRKRPSSTSAGAIPATVAGVPAWVCPGHVSS